MELVASGNGVKNDNVSSSNSEPDTEPVAKKQRTSGKEYVFVKKFKNADEAEGFVRAENTWSVKVSHKTEDGVKKYYRCNQVKYRGPQCSASIYLLYKAHSDDVILYRVNSDHDHHSVGSRSNYGISKESKEEINKLVALNMKPKAILNSLRKIKGLEVPTKQQLNNYLSEHKKALHRSPAISFGELVWSEYAPSTPGRERATDWERERDREPPRERDLAGREREGYPSAVMADHRGFTRRPVTRNSNLLSAVLCLVKELDYPSLEVAEMAVRCRMDELANSQ